MPGAGLEVWAILTDPLKYRCSKGFSGWYFGNACVFLVKPRLHWIFSSEPPRHSVHEVHEDFVILCAFLSLWFKIV